jgi:hypothetical protein
MFTFPVTLFGPSTTADIVFQQAETTQTSAGTTSFTFTSANIGTAAADRHVLVCIGLRGGVDSGTLSSVTIGGTAATIHSSSTLSIPASATQIAAIAGRTIAAGTTATVVVTVSVNMTICFCRVYTMTGQQSTTVFNAANATASNAASVSVNVNVPSNGALLASVLNAASTGSITMAGVNENADQNVGNVNCAAGHQDGLSAETPRAVSGTEAGASNTPEWVLCAASWQ